MAEPVLPADSALPASAVWWAKAHRWAYSTTAECYGHEPPEGDCYNWCVFDPDEDDPPICEGLLLEDAQQLVMILQWVAGRPELTVFACPKCGKLSRSLAGDCTHIDGPEPCDHAVCPEDRCILNDGSGAQ